MRQLHREYQKSQDAELIIVYQKEPHPGQLAFKDIAQPESFEERVALARKMKDEYELPMTVLVDTMEDQSRELFSDLPSPAFVIDTDGVIKAKFPWADAETIGAAVKQLEGKKKKRSAMPLPIIIAIFLPLMVVFFSQVIRAKKAKVEAESARES